MPTKKRSQSKRSERQKSQSKSKSRKAPATKKERGERPLPQQSWSQERGEEGSGPTRIDFDEEENE